MRIIKRKNNTADGFALIELVVAVGVLMVLAVGGVMAYSGIAENAKASSELSKCESPKNITDELVKYVEGYNVNNPNDRLGDFVIKYQGNYESETHPNQESDPKFSLLVSKVSACSSYKFETLKGDHFTLATAQSTGARSNSQESWSVVYDSRQR